MGTLLDTTVFIELERAVRRLPRDRAMIEVSSRLTSQLGAAEETGIAITTGWKVATANVRHFDRIHGLSVSLAT